MLIKLTCPICESNALTENRGYTEYSRLCGVRDDGIYELICPEGHPITTVLQTPKHEVLFTIAAHAILDGYFRESIASFAASLERFYEFAIRVICRSRCVSSEDFDKYWKVVAKQSERQLGSFASLWLIEMKEPPILLSDTSVKIRNDVIHKGMIPTYKQCIEFGQSVISIVSSTDSQIRQKFPDGYRYECQKIIESTRKEKGKVNTILRIFSVLEAATRDNENLETCLERLKKLRKHQGIPSIETDVWQGKEITFYDLNESELS